MFKTIAVAVAFSPRTDAIICEAKRLNDLFRSKLILIHVGIKTQEKINQIESYIINYKLTNAMVFWREGSTASSLIEICNEQKVDLLIAGALQKENFLKYYMGTVARQIIRKSVCSVLLIKEPSLTPRPFSKIIVNIKEGQNNKYLVDKAFQLSNLENAIEVFVAKEAQMASFKLIMHEDLTESELLNLKKELINEETNEINKILSSIQKGNVNLKTKILYGKPGYEICNFAKENAFDLLVIGSPAKKYNFLDRVFTHDLEYILTDLPCDLLMIGM